MLILYSLTNKESSHHWTTDCLSALHELAVLSHPNLPRFGVEFNLYTDASDSGLGVVLQQGNQIVTYGSRTLNEAEKQYSVIEKECLALVYAVKHTSQFLPTLIP